MDYLVQANKSGSRMLTLRLTEKLLTNYPFNVQRVQNLKFFNFKFLHRKLSTDNFLKKV